MLRCYNVVAAEHDSTLALGRWPGTEIISSLVMTLDIPPTMEHIINDTIYIHVLSLDHLFLSVESTVILNILVVNQQFKTLSANEDNMGYKVHNMHVTACFLFIYCYDYSILFYQLIPINQSTPIRTAYRS